MTASPSDPSAPPVDGFVLVRAFVDELVRCGLRAACTSPGSRSAPLVLTLARERRLRCYSHVDERCAGFFAVGLAKATGAPVAVSCTSGTAAAELLPAVIEAWEARVPLIVLTADRPPELREVGAGQAIDQLKLYGRAAKWFFEVGTHAPSPTSVRWIRSLACRAYWTALEGRPGPVHLNWPLREPLVPSEPPAPEPPTPAGPPWAGRPGGQPWVGRVPATRQPTSQSASALAGVLRARPRGVVIAGRHERGDGLAPAAQVLAHRAGYALLADPLSGARAGPAAVTHYDILLRHSAFAARHAPEVVLRVGDLPTSKPLRQWLAGAGGAVQLAIDAEDSWQDPDGVLSGVLRADPEATMWALADRVGDHRPASSWLEEWRAADDAVATVVEDVLGSELSEPAVARELGRRLPAEATLFVASSMPVRDVETFWPARPRPPRVLSNRGANGIDGTVSSAFGTAAAGRGPTALLIGDVALAHDIGGLIAARRLGVDLTIVLLDNGGGGIFDFLPIATQTDVYEEHVATPPGLRFDRAAALYGIDHHRAETDLGGFGELLDRALGRPGTTMIEVPIERAANLDLHRRVWAAAGQALDPLSRPAPAAGRPA